MLKNDPVLFKKDGLCVKEFSVFVLIMKDAESVVIAWRFVPMVP